VNRNVVTRALGAEPALAVELGEQSLHDGDLVLLCSDGLTDTVSAPEIAAALNAGVADLEVLGDRLIRLALESGGRDNVSIALGRAHVGGNRRQGWLERLIGRN
jgi:protein phosphatase